MHGQRGLICFMLHVMLGWLCLSYHLDDKMGNGLQCPNTEIPAAKLFVCVCGNKKKKGGVSVVKRHVCYRPALSKVY